MADMSNVGGLAPTQDERTMATLAQALQLIGDCSADHFSGQAAIAFRLIPRFASPAVSNLLHNSSLHGDGGLVCRHVLHSSPAFRDKNTPPTAFFAFFPLIWLVLAGCGILNLVIAIVYAIKAGQGEWAEYPLLGRLALKMLKMGPGGAPLSAQA